jgi:hypothetical protein
MALSKFIKTIFILISTLCATNAEEIKLPVLTTKQDIRNIRYITSDGKFTYYQRSNGSLQFSTNYKVTEVLKRTEHTDYKIYAGPGKKFLLVEVNPNYHTYLAARESKEIHLIEFGTSNAQKVAEGKVIGLHSDDKWFSYFNSFTKILTLQSPLSETLKHEVKLANTKNLYFEPQLIMPDEDTAIYTDLNKEGIPGILIFKINSKKIQLLHKGPSPTYKYELCLRDDTIFIGEYGLDPLTKGSTIYSLKKDSLDFKQAKAIYTSKENDLGSLTCNVDQENLFFIKTFRSSTGKLTYDAYKFSTKDNKGKRISSINFATNLVRMDKKLLLPYQDKYFILEGENNLTEFDKIKQEVKP